ncbi:unnamed protein product [Amoebophrya sp. A120]|nr:unnamed protein product [Amoebophrya sp. A120]|eukprot:GSA120T00003061001.1
MIGAYTSLSAFCTHCHCSCGREAALSKAVRPSHSVNRNCRSFPQKQSCLRVFFLSFGVVLHGLVRHSHARVALNASELQSRGPKPQYVGEEKTPDLVISNALVRDQLGSGLVYDPDVYYDEEGKPRQYRWKGDADDVDGMSCLFSKDLLIDWRQMKRILYVASYPVDPETRLYRTLGKITAMANNFGSDRNMTQVTDCLFGFLGSKFWMLSVIPPINLLEKFFDREEHADMLTDWYALTLDTRFEVQVKSGWAAILYPYLANMQAVMLRTQSGKNIEKSIWKNPEACRYVHEIDLERVLQGILISLFVPTAGAAAGLKVVSERRRVSEEEKQAVNAHRAVERRDIVRDLVRKQLAMSSKCAVEVVPGSSSEQSGNLIGEVEDLFSMSDAQLASLSPNEISQGDPGFTEKWLREDATVRDRLLDPHLDSRERTRLVTSSWGATRRSEAVLDHAKGLFQTSVETTCSGEQAGVAVSEDESSIAEEKNAVAALVSEKTTDNLLERFGPGIIAFFRRWGFGVKGEEAEYRATLSATETHPYDCPLAAAFLALAVAHFLYVEERILQEEILFFWLHVSQRYLLLYQEMYQFTFSNVMFFRYPIFTVMEHISYAYHSNQKLSDRTNYDPSLLPEECNLVYCSEGKQGLSTFLPTRVHSLDEVADLVLNALIDDNLVRAEHMRYSTPSRYTCKCQRVYKTIKRSQRAKLFPEPLPSEVVSIAKLLSSSFSQLFPELAATSAKNTPIVQELAWDLVNRVPVPSAQSGQDLSALRPLVQKELEELLATLRHDQAQPPSATLSPPVFASTTPGLVSSGAKSDHQFPRARTAPICIFMVDSRPPVHMNTLDVVEDASYISLAYAVNALYAEQHGYRLEFVLPDEERHYKNRKVGWAKVKIIENQLRKYGPEKCAYGVSVDTDAFFRSSEKLEDIIAHYFDSDNCEEDRDLNSQEVLDGEGSAGAEDEEDEYRPRFVHATDTSQLPTEFDQNLAPDALSRDNGYIETERDRMHGNPGPHKALEGVPAAFGDYEKALAAAVETQKQRVFRKGDYRVSHTNNNPKECKKKDVKMMFSLEYHYEEFGRENTHANGGFWIVKNDALGLKMLEDWYNVPVDNPERFSYYMKKGHKGLNYCFDEGMMPRYWQNVHFAHPKYFTAPLGLIVRHDWHKKLGNLRHQCREVLLQRIFERDGCIFCNGFLELEYRVLKDVE